MAFNLEAFEGLLRDYKLLKRCNDAAFARACGTSPGALADVKNRDPDTGMPRRQPSAQMIGKFADELDVGVGALVTTEEEAEAARAAALRPATSRAKAS